MFTEQKHFFNVPADDVDKTTQKENKYRQQNVASPKAVCRV